MQKTELRQTDCRNIENIWERKKEGLICSAFLYWSSFLYCISISYGDELSWNEFTAKSFNLQKKKICVQDPALFSIIHVLSPPSSYETCTHTYTPNKPHKHKVLLERNLQIKEGFSKVSAAPKLLFGLASPPTNAMSECTRSFHSSVSLQTYNSNKYFQEKLKLNYMKTG